VALSAIVITSFVWVIYAAQKVPLVHRYEPSFFLTLEWLSTLLWSTIIAGPLALALKGRPRFLIISAALFLYAGFESGIFT
jgi:hypothetical protein